MGFQKLIRTAFEDFPVSNKTNPLYIIDLDMLLSEGRASVLICSGS
jgi:hypothetical protein